MPSRAGKHALSWAVVDSKRAVILSIVVRQVGDALAVASAIRRCGEIKIEITEYTFSSLDSTKVNEIGAILVKTNGDCH